MQAVLDYKLPGNSIWCLEIHKDGLFAGTSQGLFFANNVHSKCHKKLPLDFQEVQGTKSLHIKYPITNVISNISDVLKNFALFYSLEQKTRLSCTFTL
jgi:hypothetical protein